MNIYFFRHGEALDRNDPAILSDRDRPLVDEGIRKTRQVAEGLARMQIPFDMVLTSPWLRARQTAQILWEVLALKNPVQDMDELAGDCSVETAVAALSRIGRPESVMLVGHNPLLGDLAAYLLTLSSGMQIDLKKSGICAIEVSRIPPKSPGILHWMMTPKQLRALR